MQFRGKSDQDNNYNCLKSIKKTILIKYTSILYYIFIRKVVYLCI